jgi:hypothetical protein
VCNDNENNPSLVNQQLASKRFFTLASNPRSSAKVG